MQSTSLLKAALKHGGLPHKSFNVAKRENESSKQTSNETGTNISSSGQPAVKKAAIAVPPVTKKSCLCAPTSHPGSFRCRYHRSSSRQRGGKPLSSAVKHLPRPSSCSEGVLPTSGKTVLPAKKDKQFRLQLRSSSGSSVHESRPSRLSRMEKAAATVSSKSETLFSRSTSSSSGSSENEDDSPASGTKTSEGSQRKPVEITSNSSAVLEDNYKCAVRVIQISQAASEFMEAAAPDSIIESPGNKVACGFQ